MRIFKVKPFARDSAKAGITDTDLTNAAEEVSRGEYEADLGGEVFKKRIARSGAGKSGGYRVILFFRPGERLFFRFAYAKSELDNISDKELRRLKRTAKTVLSLTDKEIEEALKDGAFNEIGP
jgi:hypothetical protein